MKTRQSTTGRSCPSNRLHIPDARVVLEPGCNSDWDAPWRNLRGVSVFSCCLEETETQRQLQVVKALSKLYRPPSRVLLQLRKDILPVEGGVTACSSRTLPLDLSF